MADQPTLPWEAAFRSKYQAGIAHTFILHYSTKDYTAGSTLLPSHLAMMHQNWKYVIFYNRSSGISFTDDQMEKSFMEEQGLTQGDEILQALDGPDPELPRDPAGALPILEQALRGQLSKDDREQSKLTGYCTVIIDFAETLAPNGDISTMSPEDRNAMISFQRWATDPHIQDTGNTVFLLTENITDIHDSIRASGSGIEAIEVPLPTTEDRRQHIEWLQEIRQDKGGLQFGDGMDIELLVKSTAGLKRRHIEDIILRADEANTPVTTELVKDRKDDIIKSEFADVIEILEPEYGFEAIGDLEHVKSFMRNSVIQPLKDGNAKRCPMGVMMTGPPGTGKTILAEATAKESGLNFVNLNMGKILGQYVGASERNLEKAIRCITSLAPTIVFIDEIDQTVQRGGGGDSGVSNRIFKRLLEFMSDTTHRGQIVFLAATNRPDLMDSAMRRAGRFDKSIPFLLPEESGRADIFKVMFRKYGHTIDTDLETAISVAATKTDGYTGAEIEALTIKSYESACDQNVSLAKGLEHALDVLRPTTADIEFMTALALKECNDKDLLPEKYKAMLDNKDKIESDITDNKRTIGRQRREL